jgi:hypothetical protein
LGGIGRGSCQLRPIAERISSLISINRIGSQFWTTKMRSSTQLRQPPAGQLASNSKGNNLSDRHVSTYNAMASCQTRPPLPTILVLPFHPSSFHLSPLHYPITPALHHCAVLAQELLQIFDVSLLGKRNFDFEPVCIQMLLSDFALQFVTEKQLKSVNEASVSGTEGGSWIQYSWTSCSSYGANFGPTSRSFRPSASARSDRRRKTLQAI